MGTAPHGDRGVGATDARTRAGWWTKARGWALLIAMITVPSSWDTMPARWTARRAMAAAALAEA